MRDWSTKAVLRSGAAAIALLASTSAHAQVKSFDVPAEEAVWAIPEFARQAGIEILVPANQLRGIRTPAVKGSIELHAALNELLAGTDISIVSDDGRTIALSAPPKNVEAASDNGAAHSVGEVETVVVTAEKRAERLLDTPVPVTVIDAKSLATNNQARLQDYFSMVPGLNLEAEGSRGAPILAIRGISTGDFSNPSVGITVDDVPYGSSTFIGGGYITPDFDPSDLKSIEVLRGPQGTLYGVSSIGGLLKYETTDPSTERTYGSIEAGISGVSNGDEPGYRVHGAVNVPLSDTTAILASAFTRHDPGYINNLQTGQDGVNSGDTEGGRLAFIWTPSDDFSLKLSALLQHASTNGSPYADVGPGFADLEQSRLRSTGGFDKNFQAYSATINAAIGGATLTSITGYGTSRGTFSIDYTSSGLGGAAEANFGVGGVNFLNPLKTSKFSQEVRVNGSATRYVDWLVGVFYTDEVSDYVSRLLATNQVTGKPAGVLLNFNNPTSLQEYAVFADLTIHVTDRFDIQIGGRESKDDQSTRSTTTGAFGDSSVPFATSHSSSFTYLFTPKYQISQDLMVYARLASGYRPGGPNANFAFLGVPATFGPDKTQNYDLGVKGQVLNGALTFDASLYDIEWKDIQLTVEAPGNSGSDYIANGGKARSQGLEASVSAAPFEGSTIGAWVAWNNATLSSAFPPNSTVFGASGDRLPFSSRWSANLSIDQAFPVAVDITGHVGAALSYVGDRVGNFEATPVREIYPDYTKIDLRAGISTGTWNFDAYVNNVGDRRGILVGGLDAFPTTAYDYIQPRTFGISVSKAF